MTASTIEVLIITVLPIIVFSLDNGRALLPPQGWTSWNTYSFDISQTKMEASMRALAAKRTIGNESKSLSELGYIQANLDDAWQACGHGVNKSFHDADGNPLINSKFPNMSAMTELGRSLGLESGWYMVSFFV